MIKSIKGIIIYTAVILASSIIYYIYAYRAYPTIHEQETLLSELGEGFGEAGLWALLFIYARTALKLFMGKGTYAKRLLPDYSPPAATSIFQKLLGFLNRTHVYVGIAAVAIILMHIALMGVPLEILFFQAVLALVIWQGLFGMFLTWRYTPKQLKKLSYLVHAQFLTGIMIGIFSYFGHLLID